MPLTKEEKSEIDRFIVQVIDRKHALWSAAVACDEEMMRMNNYLLSIMEVKPVKVKE